jgi:hypothetical protein
MMLSFRYDETVDTESRQVLTNLAVSSALEERLQFQCDANKNRL